MDIARIQLAIATLAIDARMLDAFAEAPTAGLPGLDLTPAELRYLAQLDFAGLRRFKSIIDGTRAERFALICPTLRAFLGPEWDTLIRGFCRDAVVRSYKNHADLVHFAAYLLETAGALAAGLAHYELALYEVGQVSTSSLAPEAPASDPAFRLGAGVRIVTLPCALPDLLAHVEGGEVPDLADRHYLLRKIEGTHEADVIELDGVQGAVLRGLGGGTRLDGLVMHAPSVDRAELGSFLRDLLESGIVEACHGASA